MVIKPLCETLVLYILTYTRYCLSRTCLYAFFKYAWYYIIRWW